MLWHSFCQPVVQDTASDWTDPVFSYYMEIRRRLFYLVAVEQPVKIVRDVNPQKRISFRLHDRERNDVCILYVFWFMYSFLWKIVVGCQAQDNLYIYFFDPLSRECIKPSSYIFIRHWKLFPGKITIKRISDFDFKSIYF